MIDPYMTTREDDRTVAEHLTHNWLVARAQGFPDSYVLEGTKAQQIARVGNSVCPQVAAAIVAANIAKEAAVA